MMIFLNENDLIELKYIHRKDNLKHMLIYTFFCIFLIETAILFQLFIINLNIIIFPKTEINGTITISNCSIISIEEHIHWINFTTSYHQIMPVKANGFVELYSSSIARELCRFIHIKDMYCCPNKGFAYGDKQVIIYGKFSLPKIDSIEYYENIVYLYSEWGNIFGHFVHDSLSQLIYIPKNIIEKSMIMITFNINSAMQFFELFNISKTQVLYDKNKWYFTKNLYMCYSIEPHNGFNMYSFPKIVKFLRKKLNVSKIQATRYIFMNRKKWEIRYILNFNDFYICAKNQYPTLKWEIENLNYSSLQNIANIFASIKLLVTPAGSHTIYMIFMNRNYTAGICLIQSEWIDLPNYITGYNNEIWINGFCNNWRHFDYTPHNCSISIGMRTLNNLYNAVIHQKWDNESEINMTKAFDFDAISTSTKSNIYASKLIEMHDNKIVYMTKSNGWK